MAGKGMFSGLKVLDFTNNLAGPEAAAQLADYGAEVIHIEKPVYGDDCRNFPPMVENVGTSHFRVNRGKKSLVLDLKDPKAIEVVKKLLEDTDILIESNRPGAMKRLGLSYEEVKLIKPDIIYCSISAFGQKGPYAAKPGYDIIAQAYSGMLYYTGTPEGGPTKNATAIGDFVGAINAFSAISAALYHRAMTGEGQHVDISLARGLLWATAGFDFKFTGKHRKRMGNHDAQLCPYGVFNGRNGSVVIGAVNVSLWKRLCAVMGKEELADDPRFKTNDSRVENKTLVIETIEEWLRGFEDVNEAARLIDDGGVPCIKAYTMEDLAEDPHALECGWIQEIPVPNNISSIPNLLSVVGLAEFSSVKPQKQRAPVLGQHNHEIMEACGMTSEEVNWYLDKWSNREK